MKLTCFSVPLWYVNYIGSKYKLSDFIVTSIKNVVGDDLSQKVFCDLFAGTGIVGRTFKPLVKKVISNDLEWYSFVLNKHYIGNCRNVENAESTILHLNSMKGEVGFISEHYSEIGMAKRNYFSVENAQKIDAIRGQIEKWKTANEISIELYYLLLTSLIEAADKIANTASVYGAYLKKLNKTAQKDIWLTFNNYDKTNQNNEVFQSDSAELIQTIKGDILYLDPPYNQRQYGANYHVLTTIAKYDEFIPTGKTGMRSYKKSDYCRKGEVTAAFETLIANAHFKYIFLSYNNEGLMSPDLIEKIMSKYGSYSLQKIAYQRFKSDKTASRNHKADATIEYLHILEK